MTGEGIAADGVVKGLVRDGVVILQHGVVAHAEEGIHVVRDEHPVKTIPRNEHHVLGTAIDTHEVVRDEVPCERCVIEEVLVVLLEELGRVALAGVYPLPEAQHRRLVIGIGGVPGHVSLVAELQGIVEACEVARAEEADRLGVVEELQADALVALAVQRGCVIEALYAFEAIDDGRSGLLVVEVVLAEVCVGTVPILVIEAVDREAIDTYAHVVLALVCLLWWGEPSALLEDIVDDAHRTRVVGG